MRDNTNRLLAFLLGTALLFGCGAANAVTPMLAADHLHSLFLHSDGSVWGAGNVPDSGATSPVRLMQLPNAVAIAAGDNDYFALLADGTLWVMGGYELLGDGTTQWRSQPQAVPGLSGIRAISVYFHALALKQDGTVWAWGRNELGQLGDGTTTNRYVPTQVIGLTNITKVAASSNGSLALRSDGTVWMWGSAAGGAAGDGTSPGNFDPDTNHLVPTQVHIDNVVSIAGGWGAPSLALRADGTVWVWGGGMLGSNGIGADRQLLLPERIPGLDQIVAIESKGDAYAFALKADGTVWAWGYNNRGQLGMSGAVSVASPVQVSGLSGIVAISVEREYATAMRRDGIVFAWGSNDNGQLGDGTLQSRAEPRPVLGPGGSGQLNLLQPAPTGYNQLPNAQISLSAASGTVPLAVRANAVNASDPDGTVRAYAWSSSDGQQASGSSANFVFTQAGTYQINLLVEDNAGGRSFAGQQVVAAPVAATVTAVPKIALSGFNGIALTNDGRILSWGDFGRLGFYDTQAQMALPRYVTVPVANGITGAVDLTARGHVLLADGTVLGWGDTTWGTAGVGNSAFAYYPQPLSNLPPVQALASVFGHGLALTRDGRVFAWGFNDRGQLGVGDNANRFAPVEVTGLSNVIAISAGGNHSAALKADGTVWAWGLVDGFNLGGSTQTPNRPTQIPGLSGITRIFSAMSGVIFAQAADGTVWVTGSLPFAVAGDPGAGAGPRHLAAFDGAVQIAGGWQHIIMLKADGTVWTGGQQQSFALGFAGGGDTAGIRQIPGIADAVGVAAADTNSAVLRRDGTVLTWGRNDFGQIGDGTLAQRPMPVSVVNETAGGMLDLIPEVANAPYAGAALPFFSVVASDSSIVDARPTITSTTKFNAADVGKAGAVFVSAMVPQSSLGVTLAMRKENVSNVAVAQPRTMALAAPASSFVLAQLTPTGWQQVVNGQLIPYASGVLGAQLAAQTILNGTDTTNLKGAEFCVGYGTGAAEMNATGRMRAIVTIPDPNATGTAAQSCVVSNVDIRAYVPAASASGGYVSYLRVINVGNAPAPVSVALIDDQTGAVGNSGQLTASLPALAAVTFTAQQVEAALGVTLSASARPRIRVIANTPIETQSFLLQPGGVFSEISDALGGASTITIRNYVPAAMASSGYVSYLRVINTGTAATSVTVARVDPATGLTGAAGTLNASLPAGAAITYTATQVEAALGSPIAADERSRIKVTGASSTLDVQTFLLQPNGAFTNHSSGQTGSTVDVPNYVPVAMNGYTSFIRVINDGSVAAQVSVALIDDVTGVAGSSATLISSLPAAAAMTLTSSQVEAALGINIPADSRPRIRISSQVTLAVQSFLLQPGGAFNEMSNVSSGTSVDVRTYIPAADVGSGYTSYLRVINTGVSATPVTVAVIDGATGAVGSTGTLIASLPAGGASTLTPSQVEAALGIAVASGSRPRIRITGNTALEVQSYLTQPGGAFAEVSGGQN